MEAKAGMKALIAVASKHGSTMELGRRIAKNLRLRGIEATVTAAEQVTSVRQYELVVLGTAVYANKMMPAMTAVLYHWSDQLAKRTTYLFCSGPLGGGSPDAVPAPPDARNMARVSAIRETKMFGGAMSFDRLRPTERATMRMWGAAPGDHRDWDAVDRWAQHIADEVLADEPD
jgi:menaquinone-dependent protoporphyrinogen oxidase